MKHLTTLLILTLLPLMAYSQSVVILRSLEISTNSHALVQYNNIFGNWENRDVDDSFPYVVIQMNLEGDANAISQAKLNLSLDLGTLYQVTATDKNQQNQILFLVPKGARNIYLLCGDGCTKQLLFSGALIENKVYTCTAQYTPISINNNANNDDVIAKMAAMQKQMEALQQQLQNQQQNTSANTNTAIIPSIYDGVVIKYNEVLYVPKNFKGEFIIPEGVTSIGDSAFYGCSRLTRVVIPNSVTSIGDYSFYECTSLTNVTMPKNLKYIGGGAFSGCVSLTNIIIPDKVTTIKWGAFYGCTGLTSVTISNSVNSIEECAFKGCSGLTSVTIPDNVMNINHEVFYRCTSLTNLIFNGTDTELNSKYVFDEDNNIQAIYVPAGTGKYYQKMLPARLKNKVIEQ